MPTQLNGRRIVYGSSYCSHAPLAQYSDASFWKPYVEMGGGDVTWALSGVGNTVADSKTIDELSTTMRCSPNVRCASIAASKVEARMRSFSASRSYANACECLMPPLIAAV